ncbi:MAG: hypothetical protein EZS28_023162 [Streblomastix strix]|uniref:Tyr recombinase domain-containing protein n=1 Tax=Streblomastix strix TaxID=222440 RepID=A0A5J4VFB8_9EUKA|nr:MAG: hypothetical protein EZS28_023162 [Streblomastix strix]
MRTWKKEKEEEIWQLSQLLLQIESEYESYMKNATTREQKMFTALTISIVFTTARSAEIHRAYVIFKSNAELIIETTILKQPRRIVQFKLMKAENLRDPNDLSRGIRQLVQKSGIDKKYSVTSIRSATITTILNTGISSSAVDRFTHHSEVASTVRKYYDRNNNDEARKLIAGISSEIENELEEERECAEQMGLPIFNKLKGLFNKEVQQTKGEAHILQEVNHNRERYAVPSVEDMSSSFTPPQATNVAHPTDKE